MNTKIIARWRIRQAKSAHDGDENAKYDREKSQNEDEEKISAA